MLDEIVEEILDLSPEPGSNPGQIRLARGVPLIDASIGLHATTLVRCRHPAGGWRSLNGQRLHGTTLARYRVDPRGPLGFAWLMSWACLAIDMRAARSGEEGLSLSMRSKIGDSVIVASTGGLDERRLRLLLSTLKRVEAEE